MYKTRQANKVLLGIQVAIMVFVTFFDLQLIEIVLVLILNVTIALIFGWLTIEVVEQQLKWHFGIGLVSRSIKIEEIQTIEDHHAQFYQGLGMRLLKDGWMYNAGEGDAVKITMVDHRIIYLGTPDRAGLIKHLKVDEND